MAGAWGSKLQQNGRLGLKVYRKFYSSTGSSHSLQIPSDSPQLDIGKGSAVSGPWLDSYFLRSEIVRVEAAECLSMP